MREYKLFMNWKTNWSFFGALKSTYEGTGPVGPKHLDLDRSYLIFICPWIIRSGNFASWLANFNSSFGINYLIMIWNQPSSIVLHNRRKPLKVPKRMTIFLFKVKFQNQKCFIVILLYCYYCIVLNEIYSFCYNLRMRERTIFRFVIKTM